MNNLLLSAVIATSFLSGQVSAAESDSPFAISIVSGMETYEDSPDSSLSKGVGLSLIWDDLRYDQTYKLDKNYFRVRGTYYYESNSENYDEDRYRDSMDMKFHYQRPFMNINDNANHTLSFFGHYEGHYNSQQLEEFEQLAVVGLGLNNRYGEVNHYDLGLTLGVAYSEEEKDDDWPREYKGITEDELNRRGFGYYFSWTNRYTFGHTGVQLAFDYNRYDGLWNYQDGKSYKFNRINMSVVVPLANNNNLLHFISQYIDRKSEQDLIGFDDVLYRVAVEYVHYF
ncbi:hypothetical protein L2755_14940 [Shewanella abyssi]|uniref:hypothetical protein n=1 Tax=Shewanella abyssi TaxID=311789 RepID=UPI00200F31C0|nr:hypothetical protein [Shewanella abyssi]MCL1050913.1 hypothetical protein [Shewanella abyssi]